MGQKVHPHGLRVGFYRKWNTTWFAEKSKYKSLFFAQHQLEHFLKAFFHLYSYTKNSAAKKIALVDLKWFRSGSSQLYFFVFFYKYRTSYLFSIKRSSSNEEENLKKNLYVLERSKNFQKYKNDNKKNLEVSGSGIEIPMTLRLKNKIIKNSNWYKDQQIILNQNKFFITKKTTQLLALRKKVYKSWKERGEAQKVKKINNIAQKLI